MNVTLKIDDDLCRKARHKAVDADMSLSKWIAQVVEKEIEATEHSGRTLVELIGMDDDLDLMDFIPDRKKEIERTVQFP